MAKNSTTTTTEKKQRKTRQRKAQAYLAAIAGEEKPTIVIAYTQADALKAVVTLREATHADLWEAGKNEWARIDLTAQQSLKNPDVPSNPLFDAA
jgi:hypothetical protein